MPIRTAKSEQAQQRARKVLVGGVNSPVRAFRAVGGTPPVISEARGACITDIDGNTYIDYVGSYGPAILGHAPDAIVTAVHKAVCHGASFGAPTQRETQLAEAIIAAVASAEQVRFVSSGTEAVMTAIRLARGATGRDRIVKCAGCYHGHSDSVLVSAGSGAATLGVPSSPGVPPESVANTLVTPYNDADAVRELLQSHPGEIAAVLVEPVAGNMGVVPPREGYLEALRALCDAHGALLVFDEVMTGFRVAYGGAQTLYGIRPDLTTLGKIIGGGLPVGAVAGPRELMENLAPEGPVYQAGTLSGNPAAMAAGLATLEALREEGFYEALEARSAQLQDGLRSAIADAGLAGKVCINRVGSMLSCFFTRGPVTDYASSATNDQNAFRAFFHALLEGGVYVPPSSFEAWFVSSAHSKTDIDRTTRIAADAFAAAAKCLKPHPPEDLSTTDVNLGRNQT
jgi:glutamate-1-semialdehyde 2,1-aminomutase